MTIKDMIKKTLCSQRVIIADIDNDIIYYNNCPYTKGLNIKSDFKIYLDKEIKIIYAYDRDTIKIFIKGE